MINFKQFLKENEVLHANKILDFINELKKHEDNPTVTWAINLINDFFFNNTQPAIKTQQVQQNKTVNLRGKQVLLKSLSPDNRLDILTDLFAKWKYQRSYFKESFIHYLEEYIADMMQNGASSQEILYFLTDTKYQNRFKSVEDWNEFVRYIQLKLKQKEDEKEPEQKKMNSGAYGS